jgi:hypothetical protein
MPSPTAFITFRLMPSRSSRLAGDSGGDDADVGAGDLGIILGAGELDVIAFDRPGLGEIERLALRDTLGDVDEDDVAQLANGGEVSEGAADHAGADQRDFRASHEGCSSLSVLSKRGGRGNGQEDAAPA